MTTVFQREWEIFPGACRQQQAVCHQGKLWCISVYFLQAVYSSSSLPSLCFFQSWCLCLRNLLFVSPLDVDLSSDLSSHFVAHRISSHTWHPWRYIYSTLLLLFSVSSLKSKKKRREWFLSTLSNSSLSTSPEASVNHRFHCHHGWYYICIHGSPQLHSLGALLCLTGTILFIFLHLKIFPFSLSLKYLRSHSNSPRCQNGV